MAAHAPNPLPPDVIAAARNGHKIDAIKLLREHTGMGLREAKEAVDALDVDSSLRHRNSGDSGPRRAIKFVVLGIVVMLLLYFFVSAAR
jgi:hypothetical protein